MVGVWWWGKELRRLSVEEKGEQMLMCHAHRGEEKNEDGCLRFYAVRRNNTYLCEQLVGWATRTFINFGYFG